MDDHKASLLPSNGTNGYNTVSHENGSSEKHRPEPGRFWTLALFSAASALSAVMWIALAPIESIASAAFQVDANAINLVSLTFLIFYLPASLWCMYLVERWGTKLFGAAGQPLILNIPARISMDWFATSERELATVSATMANILGQMVGSLLPPYIVHTQGDMQWLMLGQAIPCILVAVMCYLTLKERPSVAPSASAAAQWSERGNVSHTATDSFRQLWTDVKRLLHDRDFTLLMLGFSIATGMAWTLLTVQAQLIQPCDYSDTTAGASGAALLGVGIGVSYAVGPLLEKTKAYTLIQKIDMVISACAALFALAVNKPGNAGLVIGAWCVLGGALMPLLPITLEAAAEMTYPVSADTSTSVLLVCANLVGTGLTFALGALLQLPVSANCTSVLTPAAATVLAFMIAGALVTLPVRSHHRRQAAERGIQSNGEVTPSHPHP